MVCNVADNSPKHLNRDSRIDNLTTIVDRLKSRVSYLKRAQKRQTGTLTHTLLNLKLELPSRRHRMYRDLNE